jgi:IS5 family transposase
MEIAADRLSIRWFLGYDLDEALPYHSSLTKTRALRFGDLPALLREDRVEECFEAGLV